MSTMSEVEHARHAEQRGEIIRILREDYSAAMTSVGSITSALDMLGMPLGFDSLVFHLVYLSDSGYLRIWRRNDMPGQRPDRRGSGDPNEVKFAKLLPKGLQLLDGHVEADPMVRFA